MEDDEALDVMRDLPFLFARDHTLCDDLSYVCDLLSDTSTDSAIQPALDSTSEEKSELTTSTNKRSRSKYFHTNPSRDRQQHEIKALKDQVLELKVQLQEAQYRTAVTLDMSKWERAARAQLIARNKSKQENEQLRVEISEQATFIDEMTRLLRKKPRLQGALDVNSDAWREYKLAAQASLRIAAIHAIADRQLTRLQLAFIRAGIFNYPEDIVRAKPIPQPDGRVIIERVYHLTVLAPFRWIGSAVWRALNVQGGMALPEGAIETLETLDENTLYRTFRHSNGGSTAYWNFIFKHYEEVNQESIVWRSVLDDALIPRTTHGRSHDESGWLTVMPIDANTCRLTLVLNIVAEPQHDERRLTTEELVHVSAVIVDKFSFVAQPQVPGTFPAAPPKADAEKTDLPFTKRIFIERGKQMELLLKNAIDNALLQYKTHKNTFS